MAQEVVAQIRQAESQAEELLKNARITASRIVAQAEQDAAQKEAELLERANVQARETLARAQEMADRNNELRKAKNEEICTALLQKAREKRSAAADYIVNAMTGAQA